MSGSPDIQKTLGRSPDVAGISRPIMRPRVQKLAARTRRAGLWTRTGSASLSRDSRVLKHGSVLKPTNKKTNK